MNPAEGVEPPVRTSVVVTAYNQDRFVEATLRSVLAQTVLPHQVELIDDGSTDNTAAVVQRFMRVAYHYQRNVGVAESRNAGVALATCELVALLDGDDIWHPQKLELQTVAYQRYPTSGLVIVRAREFHEGESVPDFDALIDASAVTITSAHRLEELLANCFICTTSQVVIPKRVLAEVGRSNPRYHVCSDYDLYLRIAERYPITIVEAPLCFWRVHGASVSGPSELRMFRWAPEMTAVLGAAASRLAEPAASLARRQRRLVASRVSRNIYDYSTDHDRLLARRYLRDLLASNPSNATVWLHYFGTVGPPALRQAVAAVRRGMRRKNGRP